MSRNKYDCIVLGAGIAGLAAARTLAEAGRRVLVLEAQDRVGGRMHTLHIPGLQRPVELGAEFVHGRPPELLALLDEAGLSIVEGEGRQLCYLHGAVSPCPEDGGAWSLLDGMQAVVESRGDMSFDSYLAQADAEEEDKRRARNYVEGFNAAEAALIGIAGLAHQQAAEDAIEGDRVARVERGYQALAAYVRDCAAAAGAVVLLRSPVVRVQWQPGSCSVAAKSGQSWRADLLICALPLGVVQDSPALFDPQPETALKAAAMLRAGAVERIVYQFHERWWAAEHPDMHFLFAEGAAPATWWTTAPVESPLLTGWAGGPRARRAMGSAALAREGLQTLERLFDRPLQALFVAAHYHDWQSDEYARGAYSYAPAGAVKVAAMLAEPVADTLLFAGEHTDTTGHPGTVHGALRSGLRAAQQALTLLPARR